MSWNFAPSATYGNSSVKNRTRVGGALGSNQYFYITNASSGNIDVQRYEKSSDGVVTTTSIGSVPQGGKFTPNSNASGAEKTHYSSPRAVGKVRAQALQVAQREWDGLTQPPPTQAIYGTNSSVENTKSGFPGFTPSGSSTADTSVKGTQTTGFNSDTNTFSNVAKSTLRNSIRDLAARGTSNILGGSIGGLGGIGGKRGGNKVLVYPVTMRQTGNAQDFIQIDALEWAGKQKSGYSWGERSSTAGRVQGTVILPIPGGISDSNAVSWGDDKMDPAQTAMANLALSGIEGGGKAFADTAEALGRDIQNNKGKVKDALSKGIAGMASGTGAQLLTRTTGQILNPNMELLFKDPSLRPFTFTWKLAARNESEANMIIRIINFFKRGMAPQTVGGNLFLKSPHTWKLTYMHRGSPHKYLNKFKECAMTSFTTQYTPDGNYATFETGHMVAYSITMALQELDPVFSGDYSSTDEIGY